MTVQGVATRAPLTHTALRLMDPLPMLVTPGGIAVAPIMSNMCSPTAAPIPPVGAVISPLMTESEVPSKSTVSASGQTALPH